MFMSLLILINLYFPATHWSFNFISQVDKHFINFFLPSYAWLGIALSSPASLIMQLGVFCILKFNSALYFGTLSLSGDMSNSSTELLQLDFQSLMLLRPFLAGVWHQACSCRASTCTPACPPIPPPRAWPWHLPSSRHRGVNHCEHRVCDWHLPANTGGVEWTPMDLTTSQNQSLCTSWCCPLCLHGGQGLEMHWWKPELKEGVSPQQARVVLSLNFQKHLCFSPRGKKKYQQRSYKWWGTKAMSAKFLGRNNWLRCVLDLSLILQGYYFILPVHGFI